MQVLITIFRLYVGISILCFGLLLISMFGEMIFDKGDRIILKICFIFAILWPYAMFLYFNKG